MKSKILLIFLAVLAVLTLAGCSVMQARYDASTAQARAKSAEAYARAEEARAAALETEALQVTAQVAQVEASNRLMAFLATVSSLSAGQSTALMMGVCVIGAVCIVGLLVAAKGD